MKLNIARDVIIFFSCILLISCESVPSFQPKIKKSIKLPVDSNSKRNLFDFLQLDYLENGYDSLQCRIIFYHAKSLQTEILVIKNDSMHWKANSTIYSSVPAQNYDSLIYYLDSSRTITPKVNAGLLVDSINKLFLDYSFVDTVEYLDGAGIFIELATKGKYRKVKLTRNHIQSAYIEKKLILFLKKYFDFPTAELYLTLPDKAN